MIIVILLSSLWFAMCIIIQFITFFLAEEISRATIQKNALILGFIGLVLSIYILMPAGSLLLGIVYGLAFYSCFFVLYTPFYYTIATSLSVQSLLIMLRDLEHQQSTSYDKLFNGFASKDLIQKRLDLMVNNGYIYIDQDLFRLTSKGRAFAIVFGSLKKIWRLGSGG